MSKFDEDTRVKLPATIQFMRLGYSYQSLKDMDIHADTRIAINRFKPAIERLNGKAFTDEEIFALLDEIHTIIRYNDMGKAFYEWLINPVDKPKLIEFDDIGKNDYAIVDELYYGTESKGSFRPDINILINGIPLAFLEVKKPNNEGGIQAEFHRMLDQRLQIPEYRKYFNMFQVVAFSNNMEYESDEDESLSADEVKAGSFYTTPNGSNTSFSYFREENAKQSGFIDISTDTIKYVVKDNHYSASVVDTEEFQTNLDRNTPCNRFVTSLFARERFMYYLHYGIIYVDGKVPEKHIMRYPQFFASRAIKKRLDNGGKSGIIFHTQGSGKTELAGLSVRILRDYYAEKGITARFYYVVDRLDLLTQVSNEMTNRGLSVTNVDSRAAFEKELNRPLSKNVAQHSNGELTVVNVQKFDDKIPQARNEYNVKVQRIFFVDEAHRSYKMTGTYFANLMLADPDAVYIAMTGTPLLSKKERSNLKFGDYIHKYFYDKSIADGYTLRIKKEDIETKARADIRKNLELENADADKNVVMESSAYINALCRFIAKDFEFFRLTNTDNTIGGMIVCCSNNQAKKIKSWFDDNCELQTGLVISDPDISEALNTATQLAFKKSLSPDILIVNQMLTTGYDVHRLKKMYLLRNAKEHTLLQTISRVNRPYKSPIGKTYEFGYIVDFVDIQKEYDRTIDMYLKEMEEDFGEDEEDKTPLTGLVIGPDDIQKNVKLYVDVINGLNLFGRRELFIIDTQHEGLININALPLSFKYRDNKAEMIGNLVFSLEVPTPVPDEAMELVNKVIDNMNIVLQQLVPGLTLSVVDLGSVVSKEGNPGRLVQFMSLKNGKAIPFRYESAGIKKIVSILQLLIMVYNNSSITVAIDEMDSGIFEYLLGELLNIISEKGKGQLIFTSHNLRPLETIDKGFIAFATTNPENRYIRFTNVKGNNNLRDFYYRDIVLGEQSEEVYDPTNNFEIALAFREAGEAFGL